MALTTVGDLAVGDTITEAFTDSLTTNLNQHKTFAEGTAPFPGASQFFGGDGAYSLQISGGLPHIVFDTSGGSDYINYDRSTNKLRFYVSGVEKFAIDANGAIQAAAFESAETTITAGSTANIAHGLGQRPRLFGALYGTATGLTNCVNLVIPSFNSLGAYARLSQVGATNLVIVNGTAVTIYVYAFALR